MESFDRENLEDLNPRTLEQNQWHLNTLCSYGPYSIRPSSVRHILGMHYAFANALTDRLEE